MPVTQADKDVALKICKELRHIYKECGEKTVLDLGVLVNAFAAHRLAALDEAAEAFRTAIAQGYPTPPKKTETCAHNKFGWDDCIACYDEHLEAAILALKDKSDD